MKTTNQDKVNHYVNNLAQYVMSWATEFIELYSDVNKVKNTEKFQDFCIQMHNEGKIQVKILYDYFR